MKTNQLEKPFACSIHTTNAHLQARKEGDLDKISLEIAQPREYLGNRAIWGCVTSPALLNQLELATALRKHTHTQPQQSLDLPLHGDLRVLAGLINLSGVSSLKRLGDTC